MKQQCIEVVTLLEPSISSEISKAKSIANKFISDKQTIMAADWKDWISRMIEKLNVEGRFAKLKTLREEKYAEEKNKQTEYKVTGYLKIWECLVDHFDFFSPQEQIVALPTALKNLCLLRADSNASISIYPKSVSLQIQKKRKNI